MITALWRRLWSRSRFRPQMKCRRRDVQCSYRPWLEPLEGRELPALFVGGLIAPTVPAAPSMSLQPASPPPGRITPICVTVAQNTPETVIDMCPMFATIPGFQHADGLQLSVLGNTNTALVRSDLSDSALILTYRSGRTGTATIVVCATDADGVSVQQTILVTVRPLSTAGTTVATPMPGAPPLSMSPGSMR
jgi:hypothetical protein